MDTRSGFLLSMLPSLFVRTYLYETVDVHSEVGRGMHARHDVVFANNGYSMVPGEIL